MAVLGHPVFCKSCSYKDLTERNKFWAFADSKTKKYSLHLSDIEINLLK